MKVKCNNCGVMTNHTVLQTHQNSAEPDADYHWSQRFEMIKCNGCDDVSLRIEICTEDDFNPHTGDPESRVSLYPERENERTRKPFDHVFQLPEKIRRVYREIIESMNNSMPILAGVGLRALIEAICADQVATGRDLKERIDSLSTLGSLSVKQADILHSHRFLGNIAAHEIIAAKPHELVAALDIAETLLKTIYILPELNDTIRTGKPA